MAKIYKAPKPRYSTWEWFKYIAVRTVFPPILLADLIQLGANRLLGEWIGAKILPAQHMDFSYQAVSDETVSQHNTENLSCEKHEILTHDGASLDTVEIRNKLHDGNKPEHQKYIINFVGNGDCYENHMQDMKQDAEELQAHVVGFNLRGVGRSTGRAQSKDQLVIDGIAQVQRLLDQGISPQNITLKAHSLGAGVASLVTKHFHDLGQPINLFSSRSFSSVTNVIVGWIRLASREGHVESLSNKILGWLVKPFVKLALLLVNWEIDAGSAFKSIPATYREYVVVRSRKDSRSERVDDPVITHYASIYEDLSAERCENKAKERKGERKMETDSPWANGHVVDHREMHNRYGKSAHQFFKEFVQHAHDDHAVKVGMVR